MLGIAFIVLGLFLIWQSLGAYQVADWCIRLVIPNLNKNLYCMIAGIATCKFGLILGIVGILIGVAYMLEKRGVVQKANPDKGKYSYFGILCFLGIASALTIL